MILWMFNWFNHHSASATIISHQYSSLLTICYPRGTFSGLANLPWTKIDAWYAHGSREPTASVSLPAVLIPQHVVKEAAMQRKRSRLTSWIFGTTVVGCSKPPLAIAHGWCDPTMTGWWFLCFCNHPADCFYVHRSPSCWMDTIGVVVGAVTGLTVSRQWCLCL